MSQYPHPRRQLWPLALAIVLSLAAGLMISLPLSTRNDVRQLTDTISEQQAVVDDLAAAYETARDSEDPTAAAVVSGRPGPAGRAGPAGFDGVDGRDGRNGVDGRDGLPGEPGPPGEPGVDGQDGQDGNDGAPGAEGAAGVQGPPGRDGTDGAQGVRGPPGPACPPGYEPIPTDYRGQRVILCTAP